MDIAVQIAIWAFLILTFLSGVFHAIEAKGIGDW